MIAPRLALRDATRTAHERLHDLPVFAALAAGTLGREAYIALLGRLYGFHAPTETVLAATLDLAPFGIEPHAWQRTRLLRDDLAAFGWDDAAICQLPQVEAAPADSPAAALGCLYVVEGSTLGGRQIVRRLDPLLAGPAGRRFLGAGAEPGHVNWAALGGVLDTLGADPADLATMIDSAMRTFTLFELWFSGI
ncbi:MAG: biliverdin-producing heme oxygenase [Acetobacteraceae bacterium]